MKKCVHMLGIEIKRGMISKIFLLYIIGIIGLILYGAEEYFMPGCSYKLLNPDVGYPCLAVITGLQNQSLIFFLPVLAALPASGIYLDEKEHGFIKYYLSRCGRTNYVIVRIMLPIILTTLGCMIAVLFTIIISYLIFAPYISLWTSSISGSLTSIFLSLLCSCLGIMLSSVFFSMIGCLLGVWYLDRYMAYGGPFVFSFLLVIITTRYIRILSFLNPRNWGSEEYLVVNLIFVMVSAFICSIILYKRIREV